MDVHNDRNSALDTSYSRDLFRGLDSMECLHMSIVDNIKAARAVFNCEDDDLVLCLGPEAVRDLIYEGVQIGIGCRRFGLICVETDGIQGWGIFYTGPR